MRRRGPCGGGTAAAHPGEPCGGGHRAAEGTARVPPRARGRAAARPHHTQCGEPASAGWADGSGPAALSEAPTSQALKTRAHALTATPTQVQKRASSPVGSAARPGHRVHSSGTRVPELTTAALTLTSCSARWCSLFCFSEAWSPPPPPPQVSLSALGGSLSGRKLSSAPGWLASPSPAPSSRPRTARLPVSRDSWEAWAGSRPLSTQSAAWPSPRTRTRTHAVASSFSSEHFQVFLWANRSFKSLFKTHRQSQLIFPRTLKVTRCSRSPSWAPSWAFWDCRLGGAPCHVSVHAPSAHRSPACSGLQAGPERVWVWKGICTCTALVFRNASPAWSAGRRANSLRPGRVGAQPPCPPRPRQPGLSAPLRTDQLSASISLIRPDAPSASPQRSPGAPLGDAACPPCRDLSPKLVWALI